LREQAIQMGADGACQQIEPLTDLLVRQAVCGELRDLELLRSQLGPGARGSAPRRLTGRSQLAASLDGAAHLPQGIERLGSVTQRPPRLCGPPLPGPPGPER